MFGLQAGAPVVASPASGRGQVGANSPGSLDARPASRGSEGQLPASRSSSNVLPVLEVSTDVGLGIESVADAAASGRAAGCASAVSEVRYSATGWTMRWHAARVASGQNAII